MTATQSPATKDKRGRRSSLRESIRPPNSKVWNKVRGKGGNYSGSNSKSAKPSTTFSTPRGNAQSRGAEVSGTGKQYPTIPTVSRISFDFLHYIRPPLEVSEISREGFDQFLRLLVSLDGDVTPQMTITPRSRGRLRVYLLRSMSHVLYFSCQQVVELLKLFPGEDAIPPDQESLEYHAFEGGSSYREEAFIAVFSQIIDESNLDLCLGMLTDGEILRCEARLGLVALFMPTQPEGSYKLDLRRFEARQIVALLLALERADPSLQLLGMKHDGKFLETGSWPFASMPDIPKRGRFRTRVVTRRAFKTKRELALGEAARWRMAREQLGWHERLPPSKYLADSVKGKNKRKGFPDESTAVAVEIVRPSVRAEDPRPRKRAIVRNQNKQRKAEEAGREGQFARIRRWSFSDLPRSRHPLKEFLSPPAYYNGAPTQVSSPQISSQTLEKSQSRGGTIQRSGTKDCKVGGVDDRVLRTTDVIKVPAMEGIRESSGVSKWYLRRWPSSADVGMVTAGW